MTAKRILIADDSPTVRMALTRALEKAGYQLASVADGQEAVNRLKAEQFDLLLLDMEMPVMGGLEVLQFLRDGKAAHPTPVLVVTGKRKSLEEVHELKRLGAMGYVDKGMPEQELLFRVQRVFRGIEDTLV
ncbi:MAG: response regulator [Nitrospirae bacterium]|nr:response regulator [Nitrospirota bacterium]